MKRVIVKRKPDAAEIRKPDAAEIRKPDAAEKVIRKPEISKSDMRDISRIIHLSDIHIRPLQRHDEFQQVFQRTVDYISRIRDNSVAVITGDVFDNKTVFRPETFKLCRDFLKSLSSVLPVYLIAGNHDMLESNVSRMDSLTPLVEDIPGLTYLKYSGIYPVSPSLSFVVSSLYDKQFIKSDDIEREPGTRYISLFHGTVVSAKTDDGYEVKPADDTEAGSGSERHKTLQMFSGFDAVLLGDIHKRQRFTLDNGAIAAYAGSLIQQNYGERIAGHGLLVWDAETLIPEDVDIPNDYGHIDVHIQNGLWTNQDIFFPKKSYVRYVIKDSTEEQVNIINARVKELTEIVHIDRRQCIGDVRDIEEIPPEVKQQGDELELIYEQAVEMGLPPEPLVALHQTYQTEIQGAGSSTISTAIWRPISMEFKNMFGYSGDRINTVNFRNGVTSITAANATGKTSIVNILLFAIFGRTPLNPVTSSFTYDIVNSNSSSGFVKIQMEHGGSKYIIERKSLKRAKSSTAASVNKFDFSCELWRCNDLFIPIENMSDVRKKNTDTMIIELFGDIDDFSIANFLNKESSSDILTMSAADQIKALKRLFRLNIYDDYRDLNKKRMTDSLASIKELLNRKTYIESSISSIAVPEIDNDAPDEQEIKETLVSMRENLTALEQERGETVSQMISITENIDSSLPNMPDAACKAETADISREMSSLENVLPTGTGSNVLTYALSQIPDLGTMIDPPEHIDIPAGHDLVSLKTELQIAKRRLQALYGYSPCKSTRDVSCLFQETSDIVTLLKNLPDIKDVSSVRSRLDELLLQDTDGLYAEMSHLEENNRDISEVTNTIYALTRRQEELDRVRSNRPVFSTAEELQKKLVNIGTRKLYDVSGIADLRASITVINDRIRNGEVGRIDRMLDYLSGSEITEDHIEEIQQYLLEKRSGNYDPSIVKDNAVLAKSQSQLAELERLNSINGTIKNNLEIEADLYELEYLENGKKLRDIDCQIELLYISRNIILAALSEYTLLNDIQELQGILSKHEERQQLLTRLESLQAEIYSDECYRLQEKCEELNRFLCYLEQKSKYDAMMERERLQWALETQLKYERRSALIDRMALLERVIQNNKYRRQKADMQRNLAEIEADIKAQRESIQEYDSELTLAIKAREYREYREAEHNRLSQELSDTEQQIVALQQAHLPYENYNKIMNPKGISAKLLFSKIRSIQDYINTITERFTKYRIEILYDDNKQTINVLTENRTTGAKLSITRLSGYEKLMLQLAFKRALNKFSYNSKSSLIIIDEALDCIDQENFASRLPDVISLLAQDYGVTVAISQRDISHISDNIIRLHSVNGVSRVSDGR